MFPFGVALSYREEVVMKKLFIACISLCSILFFACNFGIKKDFARVEIYFGDSSSFARAVDSVTSLPELSSAYIKIEVEGELSGYSVKELKPEDQKNISLNLPIGDTVRIKVSVSNPSGIWSGSVTHTVDPESNVVGIKLKKNVSGLNNLLFTQTGDGQHGYNLTLYMGGKKIPVPLSHRQVGFARDSKGRLYVGYEEHGTPTLARYTSEGEREPRPLSGVYFLANDYTTGKMYGTYGANFLEIRDNLSLAPVSGAPSVTELFAVDNGRVVSGDWDDAQIVLGVIGKNTENERGIKDIISRYDLEYDKGWYVNDFFIRGDYLYILLANNREHAAGSDNAVYSSGAVIKWKLGTRSDGLPELIGEPSVIGKTTGILPLKNRAVPASYYSKNFYGAVKVIGFDDENIYIADDGFDAAYVAQVESPRIVKNRNRIAALNMTTNTVSFTEEYTAKWYNEWKEWRTPDTKTVVWKKNNYGGFDYYQIASAKDSLPAAAFDLGDGQSAASPDHYFTDVFCYDQDGNLYIVRKKHGSYCISRFELKDDGSYDQENAIMTSTLNGSPTAIAVDISGSVKTDDGQPVNALYYSYDESDKSCIKRLTWEGDEFSDAAPDDEAFNSGTFEGPLDTQPPSQTKTRFTALAADKNGFFVALKKETGPFGYTVRVQKYTHGGAAGGAINVLGEVTNASTWSRPGDLTALHIQEGILYGLTAVQYRYEYDDTYIYYPKDSISGKLIKIGSSTADFSGNAEVLYTTELPRDKIHILTPEVDAKRKAGGKFAPYRFIAVMPKKLIIASDGFWGHITDRSDPNTDDVKQFNFIWDFGIKDDGSLEGTPQSTETDSAIGFSKTLTRRPYCGYDWE